MEKELEQLKKLYPDEDSQLQWSEYEKTLKTSSLTLNLLQHDGFKGMVKLFEAELERINNTLKTDASLFDTPEGISKGKLFHARKQWIKDFLRPFVNAKVAEGYVKHQIKSILTENTNEN